MTLSMYGRAAGTVEGEKRNYLLYSILDVYSRKILYSLFQKSIRKADVVRAFLHIQRGYGLKGVKIRNDNGSQFISHLVKRFLRDQQAEQDWAARAVYTRGYA